MKLLIQPTSATVHNIKLKGHEQAIITKASGPRHSYSCTPVRH